MLERLNPDFRLLTSEPAADPEEFRQLESYFGHIPPEYRALCEDATFLEFEHKNGQYLRIWNPALCAEMDEGYKISARIPGAYPIGDEGGCRVIFYYDGPHGPGLYLVELSNLLGEDAVWVANSLSSLLIDGEGVERLDIDYKPKS